MAEVDEAPPFRIPHKECGCSKIPRVPLFSAEPPETEMHDPGWKPGDDDKVFTVPEYLEAHVSLEYLDILQSRGQDAATRWALITTLGRDGWQAMLSPGMDADTFTEILAVVLSKVRGSLRSGPKGG